MAMFASAWTACPVTHPFGTLNGIIPPGQKTEKTAYSCRTLTCSSPQKYLTSVTEIKGLIDVNQETSRLNGCIQATHLHRSNLGL